MANYIKVVDQKNQFNESKAGDRILMLSSDGPDSAGDQAEVLEAMTTLGVGGTVDNTAVNATIATNPAATREAMGAMPRGEYFYDIADYTTANQRNGTADATTAVQTALNDIETAMKANDGGRYTLWLGDAVLRIDGALQTTNGNNAQLVLPAIDITDHQCTLTIRGAAPVSSQYSVIGALPSPAKGAIIKSTLTTGGGITPAVIGIKPPTGSTWTHATLIVFLENVEIQTIPNPLISGVNFTFCGGLVMRNSSVNTGVYSVDQVTFPTTATSVGVIGPGINNNVYSDFDNAAVMGFYTGFKLNEHTTGDLFVFGCRTAVEVGAAYHGSSMARIGSVHCITSIRGPSSVGANQSARWNVGLLMIEHAASGPFVPVNDIEDSGNHLKGQCSYAVVLENVGESSVFVKNGGANFECRAQGDNLAPVWSTLSGTSPGIVFSNTPQVRTLTLTGNTTFTASGYAAARSYRLFITGGASTYTLGWPNWSWAGTAPASLANGRVLQVDLTSLGTTATNVVASYSEATTSSGFTISDDFNRANNASSIGTSTSGHTPTVRTATWGISSNRCYISAVPGTASHFVTWDNGSADASVQATLNTPASGGFAFGIVLRYSNANNNIVVEVASTGTLTLYRVVSGVVTAVAAATAQGYTNSQTYTVKAVMSGANIEVFVGGVSKIVYSTSTGLESNSAHGLYYYTGTTANLGTFDDFSITTP